MIKERYSQEMVDKDGFRFGPLTRLVTGMDMTYGWHLRPQTIQMIGYVEMRKPAKDVSHGIDHLTHMAEVVRKACYDNPKLHSLIDWDAYWLAHVLHDDFVRDLPPNPLSILLGQKYEHVFAKYPVYLYMRRNGFSKDDIRKVTDIVRLHPLGVDDWRRKRWEQAADQKTADTARLLTLVDSDDVHRLGRIDSVLQHVQNAFGISVVPMYQLLKDYYNQHANFSFEFGHDMEWFQVRAARKQRIARMHIDHLVATHRPVVDIHALEIPIDALVDSVRWVGSITKRMRKTFARMSDETL